ncbi:MAG TPA: ATP-binding cassette domain-containing protein, partial [Acidimicrobiia bacterium]|nr:ATP-binding cassette domain-containing protein [Acidimicrobiia bacterium]
MTEPVVRVRNLRKVFGDNEVLKGIDLDVDRGEVVVVFGRSGSGKSTLLRCINFLEEPTSGTVEVGGIRLEPGTRTHRQREAIRSVRLKAGMVFQEF